jgi:hypothetical protein
MTAYYVEPHFNKNANAYIPGYWTPDTDSGQIFPCDTEEEAIALAEELDK